MNDALPLAEVAPSASVGEGTRIGPGARIGANARVGAGGSIAPDVVVDDGVEIGDRVEIERGALLSGGARVEDEVFVGPRAILAGERSPRAIATTADLATAEDPAAPPMLRRGSSVGAGAIILSGVEVGEYALIGAGAVVTSSVPANAVVAGNPARRLGWACSCGTRLIGDDGAPAGPQPPHYGRHPELRCPTCDRVFVYVPDGDRLEERTPPTSTFRA